MSIGDLPALNATLNGICFILLILAYRAIRGGDITRHRALMLGAVSVSAAFLLSYVIYHYYAGSRRFPEVGWPRTAYLVMLASHVILAAAQLPLVITTLVLGLMRKDDAHRKWARPTFWIWAYVSLTGVLIYVLLYQVAPAVWPAETLRALQQ